MFDWQTADRSFCKSITWLKSSHSILQPTSVWKKNNTIFFFTSSILVLKESTAVKNALWFCVKSLDRVDSGTASLQIEAIELRSSTERKLSKQDKRRGSSASWEREKKSHEGGEYYWPEPGGALRLSLRKTGSVARRTKRELNFCNVRRWSYNSRIESGSELHKHRRCTFCL